jgi:hypothetical protein
MKWIIIGIVGFVAVVGVMLMVMYFSVNNEFNTLDQQISAKTQDNVENEWDAMKRTISGTVKLSKDERASLSKLYNDYAQARSGGKPTGTFINALQEAVPSAPSSLFENAQNILVAQRNGFKMRQKELIDLSRAQKTMLVTVPDKWFLKGKTAKEITVITSSEAKGMYESPIDAKPDFE